MPIHMRMRKLRGPHMKKSMPFEPFRTHTQPVNLSDLERRFDAGAEVTPETLVEKGLATRKGIDVKILAKGTLSKKLTVRAHRFSAAARAAIEAAGGTVELIGGEVEEKAKPKKRRRSAAPAPATPEAAPQPEADGADEEAAAAEPEAEAAPEAEAEADAEPDASGEDAEA